MAVAHYQFEAIHPFADGNGRTGRVLNQLMLIENNLLQIPLLYLSRHIMRHKADYYRLLLAVTREQAWEAWVLYMLCGVQETARWTTAKIDAIRELMAHTADCLRARAPKIYTRELVELIFERSGPENLNGTISGNSAHNAGPKTDWREGVFNGQEI